MELAVPARSLDQRAPLGAVRRRDDRGAIRLQRLALALRTFLELREELPARNHQTVVAVAADPHVVVHASQLLFDDLAGLELRVVGAFVEPAHRAAAPRAFPRMVPPPPPAAEDHRQ